MNYELQTKPNFFCIFISDIWQILYFENYEM